MFWWHHRGSAQGGNALPVCLAVFACAGWVVAPNSHATPENFRRLGWRLEVLVSHNVTPSRLASRAKRTHGTHCPEAGPSMSRKKADSTTFSRVGGWEHQGILVARGCSQLRIAMAKENMRPHRTSGVHGAPLREQCCWSDGRVVQGARFRLWSLRGHGFEPRSDHQGPRNTAEHKGPGVANSGRCCHLTQVVTGVDLKSTVFSTRRFKSCR